MSETILRGYIIYKMDFQIFDEIITFLAQDGFKYTCISFGSKKIDSKNGRNMFYGSLNEFIFFKSRTEGKVNRLKKSICIQDNGYELTCDDNLILLNQLMLKTAYSSKSFYSFYESMLRLIIVKSDLELSIKIIEKYLSLIGIEIDISKIENELSVSIEKDNMVQYYNCLKKYCFDLLAPNVKYQK